jgi:F-type H+-transporting ATPase subunit b
MKHLYQFAETAETQSGFFEALGIDWRLLVLQIVAFLILVALLSKFVYPWLMKSVDERQANIESAAKAAVEAKKDAASSLEKTAKLLSEARKEAAEIVNTAKLESAEMLAHSEKKARTTAEQIVADAHVQIDADIARVKKELYNETLSLVSLATKKVVGSELTDTIDNKRIAAAVKDAA